MGFTGGQAGILRIEGLGFFDPDLVTFYGRDEDGLADLPVVVGYLDRADADGDNVADVEGQARRVIDYLGLDWHDGVLEFYNTDRPVKTASATQVRKPIYTTSTNRWRKYEKYLGPLLEELGDIVPQYEAEIAHLTAAA